MSRTLFGLFTAVLVSFGLFSCGEGSELGGLTQTASDISCPAGQVPWDFGAFPNGRRSESLSALDNALLDGGTESLPSLMTVVDMTCALGSGDVVRDGSLASAKALCDGRSSCGSEAGVDYWNTVKGCQFTNSAGSIATPANVVFTCSLTGDRRYEASLPSARCAPVQEFTNKTACVPEFCYGRTRRNAAMECVPDLIKPVESSLTTMEVKFDTIERTLLDPSQPDGTALARNEYGFTEITLDQDQLYRFAGRVESQHSAPRQHLTLWISSRIPKPGESEPSMDAVRCVLSRIDLSKYTPTTNSNGRQEVAFDELIRIPQTCQDGAPFQAAVRTAWRAANYELLSPDLVTPSTVSGNKLRASYDLEDRAIVQPDPQTPVESTCNRTPLDFFFNYRTRVHDQFPFYEQSQIEVGLARGTMGALRVNPSPKTLIRPSEVSVRGLEFKVNKAGRARGTIEADLTMQMSGPDTEAWSAFYRYFSPPSGSTPPAGGGWTGYDYVGRAWLELAPFSASDTSSTALIPVPDPTVKDSDGQVVVDTSAMVPLPSEALRPTFSTPLQESGTSTVMRIPINNALRAALFNPNGKYPLVPGGATRTYLLQVCTAAAPKSYMLRRNYTATVFYKNGYQTRYEYSTPTPVEIAPTYGEGRAPGAPLASALTRCTRSGVFSFRGENIVVPLAEVELGDGDLSELSPTTSGESRLSATFDSDVDRQCQGDACVTTVSQGLGGSDQPVRSTVFQVTTEEESDGTSEEISTTMTLLGFDVFEAVESGAVSEVETTISIAPNYKAIADAFGKPFPGFEIEDERITTGVNGLSVGLEYKVPIRFGPIQGEVIFGVGAGVGLGFEVAHKYNGNVATSCAVVDDEGNISTTQDCPDSAVRLPALPFAQARRVCTYLGGTLAEPRTDEVATAIRSKVDAATELWVGGQIGNEYRANTDCGASWSSGYCAEGHKTYMRWLSDAENFRVATSFGNFATVGAPTTLNGQTIGAETVPTQKPVDSAVTLLGNTLKVRPMSDAYPSVCLRPLVVSGESHEVAFRTNLAFSAGFSVGFCTPSADLGICLEGSINLIEATLTPTLAYTHTELIDNAARSAVNSQMSTRVDWSVNLLTGALEVKLVTPFFSTGYTLISYGGFRIGEGTLTEYEVAFRKDYEQ